MSETPEEPNGPRRVIGTPFPAPKAVDVNIDMGIIHFDRKGYCTGILEEKVNLFYQAEIVNGILSYPNYAVVEEKGIALGRAS